MVPQLEQRNKRELGAEHWREHRQRHHGRDPGREHRCSGQRAVFAHKMVPRSTNLVAEYGMGAEVTTVMVRNIPGNYEQQDLLEDLFCLGFRGTFDFLYLPLDRNTNTTVGYGFVNFVNSTFASRCMAALQGYSFQRNDSSRVRRAAASPAYIQGLEANMQHYRKAAIMNAKQKHRRPLVLSLASRDTLEF